MLLCWESVSECFFVKFTVHLHDGLKCPCLYLITFISLICNQSLISLCYQFHHSGVKTVISFSLCAQINIGKNMCFWHPVHIFTTWPTEFCCGSVWMKECHLSASIPWMMIISTYHDHLHKAQVEECLWFSWFIVFFHCLIVCLPCLVRRP